MTNHRLFNSPLFIGGLAILLWNDFWLKEVFPNTLTGKLSDFAGLLVFSLFWTAFFPQYKKTIFVLVALLFTGWKSPYSESFIDLFNRNGMLTVGRVVDLTDLWALSVLPVAYYEDRLKWNLYRVRIHPIPVILFCAFAFAATSYRNELEVDRQYEFNFPEDTLISRLYRLEGLNLYPDSISARRDSIEVWWPSETCTSSEALVGIKATSDSSSLLVVRAFQHACAQKIDEAQMVEAFEQHIVSPLRKEH